MTFPDLHYIRRGFGKPLLLIHGLGGSWRSWNPVLNDLAAQRDVIAIDLPGFGDTPALEGKPSISALADAVTDFLTRRGLLGIDAVGSSMGARLVLELARRGGVVGHVVALDPGGFWNGWEKRVFYASIFMSIRLVRLLHPFMHKITRSALGRTLLFAQFSPRPRNFSPKVMNDEMHSYVISPAFDEALWQLAYGERQQGAPAGSIPFPLVIGWGRRDRVTLPRQHKRALKLFPDARLHWFNNCGHFPMWDSPQETVGLILDGMSKIPSADLTRIS